MISFLGKQKTERSRLEITNKYIFSSVLMINGFVSISSFLLFYVNPSTYRVSASIASIRTKTLCSVFHISFYASITPPSTRILLYNRYVLYRSMHRLVRESSYSSFRHLIPLSISYYSDL